MHLGRYRPTGIGAVNSVPGGGRAPQVQALPSSMIGKAVAEAQQSAMRAGREVMVEAQRPARNWALWALGGFVLLWFLRK